MDDARVNERNRKKSGKIGLRVKVYLWVDTSQHIDEIVFLPPDACTARASRGTKKVW